MTYLNFNQCCEKLSKKDSNWFPKTGHYFPQIEPDDGVMSIDYLGQTFKGDLLPTGKIRSQETGLIFNNPSAWAIYSKQIVNPAKKSGCGKSFV